jgi:hypothetical protein
MTNSSQPEERAGDYSYDLVHEEGQRTRDDAAWRTRSAPVSVTTQTPEDADGDYSYDLAHDIPAPGA